MAKKILLLEEETPIREVVTSAASRLGYDVLSPGSFVEAKEVMEHEPVDALIVDLAFDHGVGLRALGFFEARFGDSKALIISGSVKEQHPRIDWARALTAWAA